MNLKKKISELLTPLAIAQNTVVRKEMTLEELEIASEITTNWINWIHENENNIN